MPHTLFRDADHENDGKLTTSEFKEVMAKFGYSDFHETDVPVFKGLDKAIVRSIDGRKRFAREATARTTDCSCFAIFCLWWCGMIAIAVLGFTRGDPSRLMHGQAWWVAPSATIDPDPQNY
jgi:hypothetical protein